VKVFILFAQILGMYYRFLVLQGSDTDLARYNFSLCNQFKKEQFLAETLPREETI